jgi:hypothetical protein
MTQKYLLVTSLENDNIGVLRCDNLGVFETDRLEALLSDEYGNDITVNSLDIKSSSPLTLVAKCNDEEGENFEIDLCETWLY